MMLCSVMASWKNKDISAKSSRLAEILIGHLLFAGRELRARMPSTAVVSTIALLCLSPAALGKRFAQPAASGGTAPTLNYITVTPANTSIPAGSKLQFSATGNYSDGTTKNLTSTVVWNADENRIVASLSSTGLATGLSTGTMGIKAILGLFEGSTSLSVTPAVLSSITVTPSQFSVIVGGKQQFKATGNNSDGTTVDLTGSANWTSSTPGVASMGKSGLANGIKLGSTTITATSGSLAGSTTLTIGPPFVQSIIVSPGNAAISLGTTLQFTATGNLSDGTNLNETSSVVWKSNSSGIFISNFSGNKGVATANKLGPGTITATLGSISGSSAALVEPAGLQSIAVTPVLLYSPTGATSQFTATGTFAGNATQNITSTVSWTSSSPTIATISNTTGTQGLVSAIAVGTVSVTATQAGKTASVQLVVNPSLGSFLSGLNPQEERMVNDPITGATALFNLFWEPAADGFGPLYTREGCSVCHASPVPGGSSSVQVTRFGKLNADGSFNKLTNEGGPVLHPNSVGAQVRGSFQALQGCTLPANTIPADATIISKRQSPPVFGDGFIDAIADSTILANQTFQANDPTSKALGIHGVANMIQDLAGVLRPGRFGWKAQQATLLGFAGEAERFELGISDPEFPDENQPQTGSIPASCEIARSEPNDPAGLDSNLSINFAAFAAFMAPPFPTTPTTQTIAGEQSFVTVGCANCHVQSLQTQPNFQVPKDYPKPLGSGITEISGVLSDQTANLYSDLLIHDMGPGLTDLTPMGQASGSQWRTTPLWGLSHKQFLLHDGRCTGPTAISCAIQAHGGEASAALNNFNALTPAEQADVLAFLGSL